MLLNAENVRVAAFTISELLRENKEGGGKITTPPRLRLRKLLRMLQLAFINDTNES